MADFILYITTEDINAYVNIPSSIDFLNHMRYQNNPLDATVVNFSRF